MDIHQLKLELINQISQCNDPTVLQTVANVLALRNRVEGVAGTTTPPASLPNQVLEGNQALEAEAKELQQDIDDVFGGV